MGKEEENKFGLVYDGALTENIPGKVNIRAVKYELRGLQIAANIYVPSDFDENKRYAAVVVAHPNGGVKEQVAGLYA
ncbi:alpha/beta hydrolase family protein [Parablautia muri]|uniref:alpha/beta hydrolase n=1 Tax=Parablautia muri TaxID=2320879 RepID=UPI002412443C|nr:alpha/beta hydrolase [Parablautia muri]